MSSLWQHILPQCFCLHSECDLGTFGRTVKATKKRRKADLCVSIAWCLHSIVDNFVVWGVHGFIVRTEKASVARVDAVVRSFSSLIRLPNLRGDTVSPDRS